MLKILKPAYGCSKNNTKLKEHITFILRFKKIILLDKFDTLSYKKYVTQEYENLAFIFFCKYGR